MISTNEIVKHHWSLFQELIQSLDKIAIPAIAGGCLVLTTGVQAHTTLAHNIIPASPRAELLHKCR